MDKLIVVEGGILSLLSQQLTPLCHYKGKYDPHINIATKLLRAFDNFQQPLLMQQIARAFFDNKVLILHGAGNTGKSTLLRLLMFIFYDPKRVVLNDYLKHYHKLDDLVIFQLCNQKVDETKQTLLQQLDTVLGHLRNHRRRYPTIVCLDEDMTDLLQAEQYQQYEIVHLTRVFKPHDSQSREMENMIYTKFFPYNDQLLTWLITAYLADKK